MARNQQYDENNETNDNSNSKNRKLLKSIFFSKKSIVIFATIIVLLVFIPAIIYFLDMDDTTEDKTDQKNAPAVVKNYASNTEIDENGVIRLESSVLELWEKMKQDDNTALRYLDSPTELAKLIKASIALEYPDTRKDPSKKIDFNEYNLTSVNVQGIVKFKRATQDGKTDYMTYVTPEKFQEYISKYEQTHSKKDRDEALKHFTMEKVYDGGGTTGGKVPSLNGMVFMGDSILSMISINSNMALEKEGAKTMYRGGSTAKYFLGEDTAGGNTNNCKQDGSGHFIWDENFKNITNPTGFYLMIGQNYFNASDRIQQTDELIKKIRSNYPQAPIFISSVLRYLDGGNTQNIKNATLKMNEELKKYCEENVSNKVYYSDVLREYDESDESLHNHTYDDDHPNEEGAKIIIKNIKENIIGNSSDTTSTVSAGTPRTSYNNVTLNVDKTIDAHKRMAYPHNETKREFRASQSACYDGKYIIHFQNKNYGSIDASSKGGRMAWSNVETGEMDYVVETNEGGHGDGVAYDSERNVVLKCVDGSQNLLEFDNSTKKIMRSHKNAFI